eukprot:COSAG01_NODE_6433_length_3669_cov_61.729412_2_plen_37_part_00
MKMSTVMTAFEVNVGLMEVNFLVRALQAACLDANKG